MTKDAPNDDTCLFTRGEDVCNIESEERPQKRQRNSAGYDSIERSKFYRADIEKARKLCDEIATGLKEIVLPEGPSKLRERFSKHEEILVYAEKFFGSSVSNVDVWADYLWLCKPFPIIAFAATYSVDSPDWSQLDAEISSVASALDDLDNSYRDLYVMAYCYEKLAAKALSTLVSDDPESYPHS